MPLAHSEEGLVLPSQLNKQGKFVVPGEKIGVIEEFLPGPGIYVDGGDLRAANVGFLLLNLAERKMSVFRPTRLKGAACTPRPGSIVIGETVSTQLTYCLIRIWMVGPRHLPGFFTGLLHISNVGLRVKNMFNVARPGDVVRARVISTKNRIRHLSIANKKLGVIYAFCSQCGELLRARPDKKLVCDACGSIELRKLASDYGRALL
ncbi:MAG TPA: RNA-binding protein [Candidatus Bathyarchaeota archaeon]|nr:RNA-binding protein [Candidatus Bathyarchaeota archaeon]